MKNARILLNTNDMNVQIVNRVTAFPLRLKAPVLHFFNDIPVQAFYIYQ